MAPQANQPGVAQAGVVIVVGVGPGLGAALVRRFAHGGHAVAMIARSREFMDGLAAEVNGAGGTALATTADVGVAAERWVSEARSASIPSSAVGSASVEARSPAQSPRSVASSP